MGSSDLHEFLQMVRVIPDGALDPTKIRLVPQCFESLKKNTEKSKSGIALGTEVECNPLTAKGL